jgi:DNA-binding LytR/AlgR family response regulator
MTAQKMKILILEDNLKAVESIKKALKELEADGMEIEATIFSKAREAQKFINKVDGKEFDVILLDYVSLDDISFHEAVLEKADPEKVIAISNTPAYNDLAREKGVLRVVQKDYSNLNEFKKELKVEIKNILK